MSPHSSVATSAVPRAVQIGQALFPELSHLISCLETASICLDSLT